MKIPPFVKKHGLACLGGVSPVLKTCLYHEMQSKRNGSEEVDSNLLC
jgi:hypothetical protein